MKNILLYSETLAQVEYSPTHPFKPMRAKQMLDLLNRYGLLENTEIIEHPTLDEELLYLFHTPDRLDYEALLEEWLLSFLKRAPQGNQDPVKTDFRKSLELARKPLPTTWPIRRNKRIEGQGQESRLRD